MIHALIYWLTGAVLLITLVMVVRPILRTQVYLYVAQATAVAGITMLVAINFDLQHLWLTALLTIAAKAIAIPLGLLWLVKRLQPKMKTPTVLNPAPLALIAGILVVFSYVITQPLAAVASNNTWPVAVAMSVMFLGMLMVISQRAAISQMIGFLVLENGVLLLAIACTFGLPAVVELGLVIDVILGISILSLLTARMNALMKSTDTKELSELKDE